MAEPLTASQLAEELRLHVGEGVALHGDPSVALTGATHDSRRAGPGVLFCCVPGEHADGHDFAPAAVAAGSRALLCQRLVDPAALGAEVTQVVVPDSRAAMAWAARAVHHDPAGGLRMVGVTGTNGKTTVVTLLGAVLAAAGRRVAVLGTLTGARTTPEATDLQARLAELRADGVTDVVMEVSSHALALHRVDGIRFDVAVFTNLGRDHLDFHGTPEAYFQAKATLFTPATCRQAVLNLDDVRGRLLRDTLRTQGTVPVTGYSLADAAGLHLGPDGSSFRWRGTTLATGLPGRHNVSNALAVAEAARALGVGADAIAEGLASAGAVPGRFERVDAGTGPVVVVDYAHTPDALAGALAAARDLVAPGGRLTVVFGCGGDRDPGKRPEMGRVADESADVAIVTNDNPRSEDPLRIIEAIRSGCAREPLVEPDRRAAIRLALSGARPGDVVVIAGKGHESGQETAGHTEPFDDREVARQEMAALDDGGRR
jgi:UDP-N-acetylmuramoyl-L-alanyl-D-glutamate--2,6-diaminopimelate ligase